MTNEEAVIEWLKSEMYENCGGHFMLTPRLLVLLSDGSKFPVWRMPAEYEHLFRKLRRREHGIETPLPVYAVNRPQEDLQSLPAGQASPRRPH